MNVERRGTPKRYSPEFKDQAVRLVQESGRPVTQVAAELGVADQALHRWIRESRGEPDKLPTDRPLSHSERDELKRLRRENEALKLDREFLKKAAAFFAAEHQKPKDSL